MTRRRFVLGLGSLALIRRGVASAQGGKVWRIGYVHLRAGPSEREDAFIAAMSQLGYVEGRNLAVVSRWTAGATDRLPEIAAEYVRLEVDAIVASSVQATAGSEKTWGSRWAQAADQEANR